MTGTVLLLAVIALASLPLIPAWLYFRRKDVKAVWFLVCLGMGFLSVFIALLAQDFFPAAVNSNLGFVLYIFVRIALLEEVSRLAVLFPLFRLAGRKNPGSGIEDNEAWAGTAGLIAGLGFAAAESVFYAAIDPGIALLRAFTAAPLHGACGARIGSSLGSVRTRPVRALFVFIMAVLIHGMYDLFILDPALPSILSLLIAFVALGASFGTIRHGPE